MNVSREHATILFDKGRYYLADLGTVNSTFIKIQTKLVLREGTVFDVGKDNLFLVHQVSFKKEKTFWKPEDESTIDPYYLYITGKDIREEFIKMNKLRKKKLKKGLSTLIQLRFV